MLFVFKLEGQFCYVEELIMKLRQYDSKSIWAHLQGEGKSIILRKDVCSSPSRPVCFHRSCGQRQRLHPEHYCSERSQGRGGYMKESMIIGTETVHTVCLRNPSHMPGQYPLLISQISFWVQLIGGFCSEFICGSEPDPLEPLSQQFSLFVSQWRAKGQHVLFIFFTQSLEGSCTQRPSVFVEITELLSGEGLIHGEHLLGVLGTDNTVKNRGLFALRNPYSSLSSWIMNVENDLDSVTLNCLSLWLMAWRRFVVHFGPSFLLHIFLTCWENGEMGLQHPPGYGMETWNQHLIFPSLDQ